MDAFRQWLLYGFPSMTVGIAIGALVSNRAHKEVLEEATVPKPTRPNLLLGFLGVVVILVMLGAAFLVSTSNEAVKDLAAENERQAACTTEVLTSLVESLDESAELSARTSSALRDYVSAAVDGKQALADLAVLIVTPDATDEDVVAALNRVAATTDRAAGFGATYVQTSSDLAKIRREHPVPSVDAIAACR